MIKKLIPIFTICLLMVATICYAQESIRFFLCDWEVKINEDRKSASSYIGFNYYISCTITMRINRNVCIIAMYDKDVPEGLTSDANVKEILWESTQSLTSTQKNIITKKLGIGANKIPEGITTKDMFQKIIKRQFPYFDFDKMKKYLENNSSLYIDLCTEEMDL